ncbi:uncharacterized protein AAG666_023782 isoform 1-T2 [Megaptera novaeangliae]
MPRVSGEPACRSARGPAALRGTRPTHTPPGAWRCCYADPPREFSSRRETRESSAFQTIWSGCQEAVCRVRAWRTWVACSLPAERPKAKNGYHLRSLEEQYAEYSLETYFRSDL